MNDRIEYYDVNAANPGRALVAVVDSSMVPALGVYINIRQKTWQVVDISYCVDDADDRRMCRMVATVSLGESDGD